jgi:hypothetical protein
LMFPTTTIYHLPMMYSDHALSLLFLSPSAHGDYLHLPMMYSDHAPILTLPVSQHPRPNKPFRFENWWLLDREFKNITQTSWVLIAILSKKPNSWP